MRLWSIHPGYLDSKGLVAVWREGLLAQSVLLGRTRGYRKHPQLERFKNSRFPLGGLRLYLVGICREADRRGYSFDRRKIKLHGKNKIPKISVKRGQVEFEWQHLLRKLKARDIAKYREIFKARQIRLHPVFRLVPGGREDWERGSKKERVCSG